MAASAPIPTGFVAADWGRAASPGPTASPLSNVARLTRTRPALLQKREMARVAALVERAKQVLHAQFDALRRGDAIDLPAMRRLARDVAGSIARNRHAVIGLTRLRTSHEYTYVHSVAVCALMVGVARELGLPENEVQSLGLAGMLHDIGKSKVPVRVLDKPGPLDTDEWATIRTHPERGAAILARMGEVDAIALDVALHHHERIDGSGYPHGLAGDAIGIHARIAAVCDVYDALTSRRAYKDARPAATVLDKMAGAVGHFDPRVLRALRSLIGAFPAGTLVRLQRGQLARVVDEVADDPLSPRVEVIACADTRRALPPAIVGTRDNPIVGVERIADWTFLIPALSPSS